MGILTGEKVGPTVLILGVIVLFGAFGLKAIPHLFFEINFYRRCGWDLHRDSGVPVLLQSKLKSQHSYVPIGVLKILVLLSRVVVMLTVSIPLSRAILVEFR